MFTMLSSKVEGAVNPGYQWYHNGTKLSPQTVFGADTETVRFFFKTLASQGIYQLFVSSNMGRIFGREVKVEFIGKGVVHSAQTQTMSAH